MTITSGAYAIQPELLNGLIEARNYDYSQYAECCKVSYDTHTSRDSVIPSRSSGHLKFYNTISALETNGPYHNQMAILRVVSIED